MRQPIFMALVTGLAAGAAGLSLPSGLIEYAVTASGLSEWLPAAAPPLGGTARMILAGFVGVMGFGVGLAAIRLGAPDEGDDKMGFAFSKLTGLSWSRRRNRNPEMPVVRTADAHPDAPPRKPIFASADFGAPDFFSQPSDAAAGDPLFAAKADDVIDDLESHEPLGAPDRGDAVPTAGLGLRFDPPFAFESEPEADEAKSFGIFAEPDADAAEEQVLETADSDFVAFTDVPAEADVAEPLPSPPLAAPSPLHALSVAELAHRLETALTRREEQGLPVPPAPRPFLDPSRVLADITPAAPVAVKPGVDSDVDIALKQALGALQKISTREA